MGHTVQLAPRIRAVMTRHIDLPGLRWYRVDPGPTDDQVFPHLCGAMTCSVTAASCFCPLRAHRARCPCSFAATVDHAIYPSQSGTPPDDHENNIDWHSVGVREVALRGTRRR